MTSAVTTTTTAATSFAIARRAERCWKTALRGSIWLRDFEEAFPPSSSSPAAARRRGRYCEEKEKGAEADLAAWVSCVQRSAALLHGGPPTGVIARVVIPLVEKEPGSGIWVAARPWDAGAAGDVLSDVRLSQGTVGRAILEIEGVRIDVADSTCCRHGGLFPELSGDRFWCVAHPRPSRQSRPGREEDDDSPCCWCLHGELRSTAAGLAPSLEATVLRVVDANLRAGIMAGAAVADCCGGGSIYEANANRVLRAAEIASPDLSSHHQREEEEEEPVMVVGATDMGMEEMMMMEGEEADDDASMCSSSSSFSRLSSVLEEEEATEGVSREEEGEGAAEEEGGRRTVVASRALLLCRSGRDGRLWLKRFPLVPVSLDLVAGTVRVEDAHTRVLLRGANRGVFRIRGDEDMWFGNRICVLRVDAFDPSDLRHFIDVSAPHAPRTDETCSSSSTPWLVSALLRAAAAAAQTSLDGAAVVARLSWERVAAAAVSTATTGFVVGEDDGGDDEDESRRDYLAAVALLLGTDKTDKQTPPTRHTTDQK